MRNVTDRTSNPFGMRAPREDGESPDGGPPTVFGYGDANADVHLVGDYPGRHGGAGQAPGETTATGVPFTGSAAGRRLQPVLHEVGLLEAPYSDRPAVRNLFASYLHMTPTPGGRPPTESDYAELEPYFDAELRAIGAHVLLPVGERPIRHVLEQYTAKAHAHDPADVHATEIAGSGWLVVPVREPTDWREGDADTLREALADLLATDYRQLSELGRFFADEEPYYVR